MNYPKIFERAYLRPVAITPAAFRAINAVLRPRLLGQAIVPEEKQEKRPARPKGAFGRQDRPAPTYNEDGRVTDERMYSMVAPGIATVAIKGILARNVSWLEETYCGMSSFEPIGQALAQAEAAEEVQAIILDIDSPGGECNGTFELADQIAGLDKPVYAFSDGQACSAAYCMACAALEVFCTTSAVLGSIGVICAILDDTMALAADGFKMEYFTAGAHKAIGGSGYTMSDADRVVLQEMVDYSYDQFANFVRLNRGEIAPLTAKSAEIYTGQQSVDAGLCDAVVGGFAEVVIALG